MAKRAASRWAWRPWTDALGCAALLAAWLALAGPLFSQAQSPARGADPLQTISRWTNDYRRQGANLDPETDSCLPPALQRLRSGLAVVNEGENETLVALCDLASVAGSKSAEGIARGRYVADQRESNARGAARAVIAFALDAPSGEGRGHWLATHVLAGAEAQPIPRRIAVCEVLAGRHWDSTMLALFTAAVAPERGLREAAVTALAGWPAEPVDRFLANLTLRALREGDFLSTDALLEHFSTRALPVGNPAAVELANALTGAALSSDWREAVRRIPLSRVLPNELAVPKLVEALALWSARGTAGSSSRRVEALLVAELERRSGARLGMSAERWAYWWKATRERDGRSPGSDAAGKQVEGRTTAGFFGLHPWTDRVVFVIDRSGSMGERFGTDSASRYNEALRQLEQLLVQLGPRTHFNLILFSDEARAWSADLRPATPALIEAALVWARNSPPKGGTILRQAVARALELDPRTGKPDLERLEADTVIVLCDGATAEGSGWVEPLMRAVREPTCVRFDCVQIGSGGDGTLEALAAESGGQFVRVDS